MTSLLDKQLNSKWAVLGIGTGGSAKTPALASFAALGPTKIYNFDGAARLDPIIHFYTKICKRPDIIANIDFMNVGLGNFKDFMVEFEKLQDDCPWTNVMVDSITSGSVSCISWQMMQKNHVKGAKQKLSGGDVGIPIPDWTEFNGEANWLAGVLEIGKSIEANFLATAHPITRTAVEGSGKNLRGSKYTSLVSAGVKGVDLIPNYFNEIWKFGVDVNYTDGGVERRRIIETTKSTSDDLAKNTCGLPDVVDFTNKVLFDEIQRLLKEGEIKRLAGK